MEHSQREFFKDKNVLITGGAGFLGSSLAISLVDLGAKVTILDPLLPLYGGNIFNLQDILKKITFVEGDIRDKSIVFKLVRGQDFIFNFAAQVSYIDSKNLPLLDLDINCRGHLNVLEAVRAVAPKCRIVFSSSRMVYGKILNIPVTEDHPTNPLSIYGIHKLAAEKYYQYYHGNFGIDSVVVRIPNPYGPRQQMKHNKYSMIGWFIRQAMEGKKITIFGDGSQERDYLYIDDIVDAFLKLAQKGKSGEIYNIGTREKMTFIGMVNTILAEIPTGKKEHVPWPENYEKNETGNYVADTIKIEKDTAWLARVSLREGIKRTIEYYKKHSDQYFVPFEISAVADEYINRRYPRASRPERQKYINDWVHKVEAAQGVVADFTKRVGDPKGQNILDAGSGNGGISIAFAKAGAKPTGVEIEEDLHLISLRYADTYNVNINWVLYDGDNLPFGDHCFDSAISVSVLEHTSDPVLYLQQILRTVKPGGMLYLAFPNKLWPKETHTQIWFLTYLPKFLRPRLISLLNRNPLEDNNLHFYSYWDLQNMLEVATEQGYKWRIVEEVGQTSNKLKILIKNALGFFGIPYKSVLSHVSLILKKEN